MERKTLTFEQTKEKALRLLTFRAHSEKELRDKLKAAGGVSEDIDRTVDFCIEYQLLNDRDYAVRKAKDLAQLKKYGKRRIMSELYAKGISREDIEEAMFQLEEELPEPEETLLPLVEKRLRGDFDQKNKDKTIRYFLYRGYDLGDIKRCISRLEDEAEPEDDSY